jgi:hypothetical protein
MKMSSVLIFLYRESTSVIEQSKQREIENTHPVIESKYGVVGQRFTFFAEVYFTMQKSLHFILTLKSIFDFFYIILEFRHVSN